MYTLSSKLILFLSAAVLALSALFATPLLASANEGQSDSKKVDSHNVGSAVEVRMANDNSVVVRGAKVTSISGSVINVQTAFGSSVLSWNVRVGADTKIITLPGGPIALAAISVGDYVSFSGLLDTSVSGLTVNAKVLKDWSQIDRSASFRYFNGSVQSVDVANKRFTLKTEGAEGVITVALATTSVMNGGEGSFTIANLAVGNTVKVSGTYDAALKVITAEKVHIEHKDEVRNETHKGIFESLWDRFGFHNDSKK